MVSCSLEKRIGRGIKCGGDSEKPPHAGFASPLTGPLFGLIGSSSGRRAGRSGIVPVSEGADIVKLFCSRALYPLLIVPSNSFEQQERPPVPLVPILHFPRTQEIEFRSLLVSNTSSNELPLFRHVFSPSPTNPDPHKRRSIPCCRTVRAVHDEAKRKLFLLSRCKQEQRDVWYHK